MFINEFLIGHFQNINEIGNYKAKYNFWLFKIHMDIYSIRMADGRMDGQSSR